MLTAYKRTLFKDSMFFSDNLLRFFHILVYRIYANIVLQDSKVWNMQTPRAYINLYAIFLDWHLKGCFSTLFQFQLNFIVGFIFVLIFYSIGFSIWYASVKHAQQNFCLSRILANCVSFLWFMVYKMNSFCIFSKDMRSC